MLAYFVLNNHSLCSTSTVTERKQAMPADMTAAQKIVSRMGMTDEMVQHFLNHPSACFDLERAVAGAYDKRRDQDADKVWLPLRKWHDLTDDLEVRWDGMANSYSHDVSVRRKSETPGGHYSRRLTDRWVELLDGFWIKRSNWPGNYKEGHEHFLVHREPQQDVDAA